MPAAPDGTATRLVITHLMLREAWLAKAAEAGLAMRAILVLGNLVFARLREAMRSRRSIISLISALRSFLLAPCHVNHS